MKAQHLHKVAIDNSRITPEVNDILNVAKRTLATVSHMAVFMAEKAGAKADDAGDKPEWLVWSNEHSKWWLAGGYGYTPEVLLAGFFTFDQAAGICRNAAAGGAGTSSGPPNETMVRTTDLFRGTDWAAPTDWLIYELEAGAYVWKDSYGYIEDPDGAHHFTYIEAMGYCLHTNKPGKPLRVVMVPAATVRIGAAPKPGEPVPLEAIPGLGLTEDQIRLKRIATILEATDVARQREDQCTPPGMCLLNEVERDIYALAMGHNEDWRP